MNVLGEILGVAAWSEFPASWNSKVERLEIERNEIMKSLSQDNAEPVYGFTTMLGHLDGNPLASDEQSILLKHHLVGQPLEISSFFYKLLGASEMQRLLNGGTGVSVEAVKAVVSLLRKSADKSYEGAWLSSYGSGDVVPGAWWLKNLLEESEDYHLAEGDLIALISGTWVSSSLALLILLCAAEYFSEVLSAIRTTTAIYPKGERQLPISLRDISPFQEAFTEALLRVKESLIKRYSKQNGNPLFKFEKDNVTAQSQNSYLDFGLTLSLTNLLQTIHLAIGLWQRVIQHSSIAKNAQQPINDFVQPAKVAQAEVQNALLSAGVLPANFTGAESEGIEDVRDLSLSVSLQILKSFSYLDCLKEEWFQLQISEKSHSDSDLKKCYLKIFDSADFNDKEINKLVFNTKDLLLKKMKR